MHNIERAISKAGIIIDQHAGGLDLLASCLDGPVARMLLHFIIVMMTKLKGSNGSD